MSNSKLLIEEVFVKAQQVFFRNPTNEKAKKLFIDACKQKILSEAEEKFNLFGLNKKDVEQKLSSSEILQKEVLDPPFGLKVAMCFGELTEYEHMLVDYMENYGIDEEDKKLLGFQNTYFPYARQKGQIDTGQPGTEEKIGDYELKYDRALKDKSLATSQQYSQSARTEVTLEAGRTWIPFDTSKLANAISTNNYRATISAVGAGQIEYIARTLYAASRGMDTSLEIPSKISMQPGVSKQIAEEQETFILQLGEGNLKSKIARRLEGILEVYLILVVEKILQPILKFESLQDFAYEGVKKAIRRLIGLDDNAEFVADDNDSNVSVGKYDFDYANFGAWAYTVVKNFAKDQLKGFTDYVYDNTKAADWVYGLDFPFTIESKLDTKIAKGSFKESFKRKDKLSGKVKYYYTYIDKISFLKDLQSANGYDISFIEKGGGETETRGRKSVSGGHYQRNNPLFKDNLSDVIRGNFMTSIKKYIPSDEEMETPGDIENRYISQIEKKQIEQETANIVKNIREELLSISKEIIDKTIVPASLPKKDDQGNIILKRSGKPELVKNPDYDKYGEAIVSTYVRDNKNLAILILVRLFAFGVYKFIVDRNSKPEVDSKGNLKPRGSYEWKTAPQMYLDDFIESLETVKFQGEGLPSEVKNKDGNSMPIKEFIQLLRKVVLGSGKAGPELEKYFKTGKENSPEFKQLVNSKGFLLQNPTYLRKIYNLLLSAPKSEEIINNSQSKINEQLKNIKILISELKNEFNNYNKSIITNFKLY